MVFRLPVVVLGDADERDEVDMVVIESGSLVALPKVQPSTHVMSTRVVACKHFSLSVSFQL